MDSNHITEPWTHCVKCRGLGRVRNDLYYGKLFQNKRLAAGLTLKVVATQMGVTLSYLSDLEHGRKHLGDEMMQRISDAIATLAAGAKGKE